MRVRVIAAALVLAGCTVVSPDPARDSGATPDASEPCVREVELEALGPHADRVLCPVPADPPSSVTREDVRAMLRELGELEHRYCEEERARISRLGSEDWASELAIARTSGRSLASMEASLGPFGLRALDPLPRDGSRGCTIEERATEWIRRHRALWMLESEDDLSIASVDAGAVVLEQRWRGLPVANAGLVLHEGPHGFSRLEASVVPSWAMPASALPRVTSSEAIASAREGGEPTSATLLSVWPDWTAPEPSARLAWIVGRCVVDANDRTLVTCNAR